MSNRKGEKLSAWKEKVKVSILHLPSGHDQNTTQVAKFELGVS